MTYKLKSIIFFLIFLFITCSISLGDYSDYKDKLEEVGINVSNIENSNSVSRYKLSRLINASHCYDCKLPPEKDKLYYNILWWQDFKSQTGNNFDDIDHVNNSNGGQKNFYCIAKAADKNNINGYPSGTFEGEFRGENNVSYSELIYVLSNQLINTLINNPSYGEKYIQENYPNFEGKLTHLSFRNFLSNCNDDECGFIEYDTDLPKSEFNFLVNEGIINSNQFEGIGKNEPVPGQELLKYIFNLADKSECEFDMDYDDDGVKNKEDNCIYDYNPGQKDNNKNGKGNVCDDNLISNGNENPDGLLDENGNIDISKKYKAALHISGDNNIENIPSTKEYCPDYKGDIENITWRIYKDGNIIASKNLNSDSCFEYDFENFGNYQIDAVGKNGNDIGVAESKMNVFSNNDGVGSYIYSSSNEVVKGEVFGIDTIYKGFNSGNIKNIKWNFGDGHIIYNDKLSMKKYYKDVGSFEITQTIKLQNGKSLKNKVTVLVQQEGNIGNYTPYKGKKESQDKIGGFYIEADPNYGQAPLEVNFNVVSDKEFENIKWNFDDGSFGSGKNMNHTYQDPGLYTVLATAEGADKTLSSKLTIQVKNGNNNYEGFGINCESVNQPNYNVLCKNNYKGDISYVSRDYKQNNKKKPVDRNLKLQLDEGKHTITGSAYDSDNNFVAKSSNELLVTEDGIIYSSIEVSNLVPFVGESIDFSTNKGGFNSNDVEQVYWDFGNGENIPNSLSSSWAYKEKGKHIVQEDILFFNGKRLKNTLTLAVKDNKTPVGSNLSVNPITQSVGDNVEININLSNIDSKNIKRLKWDFGDGNIKEYTGNIQKHLNKKYSYKSSGFYSIHSFVYLENGKILTNEASIHITGGSICSKDLSNFQCDLDKDGIPDVCDKDMSGDGYENKLGLIKYEKIDNNGNCIYDKENINVDLLKEQALSIQNGADFDVCPFKNNPEQIDNNGDGIGNACDYLNIDLGSNKGDLEIPDISHISPYVEAVNCNSCPCHYAEYESDIRKGDKIRAILYNDAGDKVFSISPAYNVTEDIGVTAPDLDI